MNRLIFLSLLRLLASLALCFLAAMLYWSSLVVEENTILVRKLLQQLQEELQQIKQLRSSSKPSALSTSSGTNLAKGEEQPIAVQRPHIDDRFENLLHADTFYSKILPTLLPKQFHPRGTLTSATVGRPDHLHPFSPYASVQSWYSLCLPSVGRSSFGYFERPAPALAIKLEERPYRGTGPYNEFWVHLRDGVYWQPLEQEFIPSVPLSDHFTKKHQVTSADFKFFFDALMNPYVEQAGALALRTAYGDIEEIEVVDPLTFIVRWKPHLIEQPEGPPLQKIRYAAKALTAALRPLPTFLYQYFADGTPIVTKGGDGSAVDYRTDLIWARNFNEHWAKQLIPSCGAYLFAGMNDQKIAFKRNLEHYEPLEALVAARETLFKLSIDGVWQAFKNNDIDSYSLGGDRLLEVNHFLNSPLYKEQEHAGNAIHRLDYFMRAYTYIGWNSKRPFFSSSSMRRAMTLAINREGIIHKILRDMGRPLMGGLLPSSQLGDGEMTPWPYSPEKAIELLHEQGWEDLDGDGILDKEIDGKRTPLRFHLNYYVKNPETQAICEAIRTDLTKVKVDCQLRGMEIADLTNLIDDKEFDGYYLAWTLGTPPEDPRQLWHSSGASEKGSSNTVGFASKEVDQIITLLDVESNPAARQQLYRRFYQILHQEQPYTFLYVPENIFLWRSRVKNVFIPKERQDLLPGAEVDEIDSSIFYLE